MKIKITTDSTADTTKEHLDSLGIGYIPLIVNLGEKECFDTVNVSNMDIRDYVNKTKKLPKTAARSSEDIKDFFLSYLNEGYDKIIHISISEELSCTYNNAVNAAKEIGENKVAVISSRVLSTGSLLLAMCAKELVEKGESFDNIVKIITQRAYNVQVSFVVDTIDYLHKGGRCSTLKALGANLLKLRPKLQLVDGKIISNGIYRGKMNVLLKKYIDDTLATYNNPDTTRCFITHADADNEVVKEVIEYVKSKNVFKEVCETRANSTIYCHCGKGTLGILYINDGGKF